jgi:hypothetical protein
VSQKHDSAACSNPLTEELQEDLQSQRTELGTLGDQLTEERADNANLTAQVSALKTGSGVLLHLHRTVVTIHNVSMFCLILSWTVQLQFIMSRLVKRDHFDYTFIYAEACQMVADGCDALPFVSSPFHVGNVLHSVRAVDERTGWQHQRSDHVDSRGLRAVISVRVSRGPARLWKMATSAG